jgi:hypothetical protein
MDEQIALLRECAAKTNEQNNLLIKIIRHQTIIYAIALVIVCFIAFSFAFGTPYPFQSQTNGDVTQTQGGIKNAQTETCPTETR